MDLITPTWRWPVITSSAIFLLTYTGILTERLHRTPVTLIGALALVCVGTWLSFYSREQAAEATDAHTIALLFGMMVIVGLFRATGFFEYLAIRQRSSPEVGRGCCSSI